jgi:hypothetical protein
VELPIGMRSHVSDTGWQTGRAAGRHAKRRALPAENNARGGRSEFALAVGIPAADPTVRGRSSRDVRTEGGVPGRHRAQAERIARVAWNLNPDFTRVRVQRAHTCVMRDTLALVWLPLARGYPFADARAAKRVVPPAPLPSVNAAVPVEDERPGFLLPFVFLPARVRRLGESQHRQSSEPKSCPSQAAQHIPSRRDIGHGLGHQFESRLIHHLSLPCHDWHTQSDLPHASGLTSSQVRQFDIAGPRNHCRSTDRRSKRSAGLGGVGRGSLASAWVAAGARCGEAVIPG